MKQNNPKTISIIIPVLNEEVHLGTLLPYLLKNNTKKYPVEILVVDGGSSDDSVAIASNIGATVLHSEKGRAKQMNLGVKNAKGDVLYFLHADTIPPKHFDCFIMDAVHKGAHAGCFRMKFKSSNWILLFFGWMTQINLRICRGGDQSLFITKELTQTLIGFNEDYMIYEDNEFIGRIYKLTTFKILPHHVLTSARKYEENGILKLQYHFSIIHLKKFLGAKPADLYLYYRKNILS